jgi:RNA polymerase sigma factor (sigma-70 family)
VSGGDDRLPPSVRRDGTGTDLEHGQRWLGEQLYVQKSSLVLLEMFRASKGKDQDAFTALFLHCAPLVQAICRSISTDPGLADDALQETFVALFLKDHQERTFSVDQELEGWLRVTARRIAQRRSAQARKRAEHESGVVREATEEPLKPSDRERVREAMGSLPENYRTVLELRFLNDLSVEEIARRLGNIPSKTVWTRIDRGLKRLQPRLERLGFGPAALVAVSASVLPGVSGELAAATLRATRAALANGNSPLSGLTATLTGRGAILTGVLLLGLVGAAGVVLWPGESVPRQDRISAPIESLQEQNLRVFEAEVWPALLDALRPYLTAFEGRIEWVRAEGSDVSVLVIGTRVAPPLRRPPRLLLRYCTLTRELKTDLDDPWEGKWRSITGDNPVVLALGGVDILKLPLPHPADLEKAFAALLIDARAADEFQRQQLASARSDPGELSLLDTPNIYDFTGHGPTLFAKNGGVIVARSGPEDRAEWRYLCTAPGERLAVNDTALYLTGSGGRGTLRRSRNEPNAAWRPIGEEPPRWGWNDFTATNELLFTAEVTRQLWARSAGPESDEWSEAGMLPPDVLHSDCLCAVGNRLFAYTRGGALFSRPGSRQSEPWQAEGELPEGARTVVAQNGRLLTWTKTEWLTRPLEGGAWKTGGPLRRVGCPRWQLPRDVVEAELHP